jgi:hypothetical protein
VPDNWCQVVEEPGHRHAKPRQGQRAHHEIVVINHDWEELPSGTFFWAECGCYTIREAQDNLVSNTFFLLGFLCCTEIKMEICSSQKASSSVYLEYLSSVWLFDLEYPNPQKNQIVLGLPYSAASTLRPKKSPGRQLFPIVINHHDLVVSSPPLARLGMAVARFFYYLAPIVFKASFLLNHKTKTTLNVKQCESADTRCLFLKSCTICM